MSKNILLGLAIIGGIVAVVALAIAGQPSEEQHRKNLSEKYKTELNHCEIAAGSSNNLDGGPIYTCGTKYIENDSGHATGLIIYLYKWESIRFDKMLDKTVYFQSK